MRTLIDLGAEHYDDVIEETLRNAPALFTDIDDILTNIRNHIRTIDERVFARRNDLLIAIRLVEAFRIFNWIKVSLVCGSYHSVFRELRFMLDGVAQGCYIDLNHIDAPLSCKLEVYKALGQMGGFMGGRLFEKIGGLPERKQIGDLYRALSRFVHPSVEESRVWIESPASEEKVVDSLKYNRHDSKLLDEALTRCREVGNMLIQVNSHFVENFLQSLE